MPKTTVKAHKRVTKSGTTVMVKAHEKTYDSADDMAKIAIKAKAGAGREFEDYESVGGPNRRFKGYVPHKLHAKKFKGKKPKSC